MSNIFSEILTNRFHDFKRKIRSESALNVNAVEFTCGHNHMMNLDNDVNVQNMLLPLVSVTVNGEIETVALLDPASTHSFVKKSQIDYL